MDLYEVLEINRVSSAEEIKKAYRKLAVQYHPDKNQNDINKEDKEKKFKEINEAYSILSDPTKKKNYDLFGTREEMVMPDMSDLFSKIFNNDRSMNYENFNQPSPFNFEDIINEFSNMNCEVHVTHNMGGFSSVINDILNVDREKFKVKFKNRDKTPEEPKNNKKVYTENTESKIKDNEKYNFTDDCINDYIEVILSIDDIIDGDLNKVIEYEIYDKCKECDGLCDNISCYCMGNKLINVKKNIELTIKPGIKDNHSFTFFEKGSYNLKTNQYNDLTVISKYNLPKNLKIKGNHLIIYLDLTLNDIFNGFTKTISIGKKTIDVKIDNYINPNDPIIYKSCGIPIIGTNKKGNIIILPKVIYPKEIKVQKYQKVLQDIFNKLY